MRAYAVHGRPKLPAAAQQVEPGGNGHRSGRGVRCRAPRGSEVVGRLDGAWGPWGPLASLAFFFIVHARVCVLAGQLAHRALIPCALCTDTTAAHGCLTT